MFKNERWYKITIIVLTTLILLFGFLTYRSNGTSKRYDIAVVLSDSENQRWDRLKLGIKQASTDLNVNVRYLSLEEISDDVEISDGYVLGWSNSEDITSIMSKFVEQGPIVQISDSTLMDDVGTKILPNSNQMGKSLASEIVLHNKEDLRKKNIGIVTGSLNIKANIECKDALIDSLNKQNARIKWTVSSVLEANLDTVDILVVLDPLELEKVEDNNDYEIYGIGGSVNDAYRLDIGEITSLMVINDYYTGYEAIDVLVEKLENNFVSIKDKTVAYYVINKENLFSSENQKVLFLDRN